MGAVGFPVYTRTHKDPLAAHRTIRWPEVNLWFARPGGEGRPFNFLPKLHKIQCITLVLGGEDDPSYRSNVRKTSWRRYHLVRFERFPNCGHSVIADAPQRALAVIHDFIAH